VILVKKHYGQRKKRNVRNWKLKRMAREESDMKPRKQDMDRDEIDYEQFLQDLEADSDLRTGVNLYHDRNVAQAQAAAMDTDDDDDHDDDGLAVPMDQLIDELEDMAMDDDDDEDDDEDED